MPTPTRQPTKSSLNCSTATNAGTLSTGVAASGVSFSIPYTGGNGGAYPSQSVVSSGVTGLIATVTAGTFAQGSGSVIYTISGTPNSNGIASFAISLGGQTCTLTRSVVAGMSENPNNESAHNQEKSFQRNSIIGNVKLYPNPTNGVLNLELNSQSDMQVEIAIQDVMGRISSRSSKSLSIGENYFSMDLNDLSSGIYFIRIESNDGLFITKVFEKY